MPPRKVNNLKDMVIKEISLVTDPASPGAVVLFTKRRGGAEVQLWKDGPEGEARDARGRWTRAAVAAVGSVKGAVRQMAQAFSDRAKAAAHATLGHAVSAVKTTRPRGAYPVAGGGVQFDFEHTLANDAKYHTSVQIRPEHLRSAAPRAYGGLPGYITEGTDNLSQAAMAASEAAAQSASREHSHGVAYRALGRVEQLLRNAGHQEQPAFNRSAYAAGQTKPGGRGFSSFFRAQRVQGAPPAPSAAPSAPIYPGQSYGQQQAARTLAMPALSTEAGWLSERGPLGIPVIRPTAMNPGGRPPAWVAEAQQVNPTGKGAKTENGHLVPLAEATARTAGSWPYYRNGIFVPGGSPHLQEHIEAVHDWIGRGSAQEVDEKTALARRMAATPTTSNGKGYFTGEGHYIPPGNPESQGRFERRYNNEADRLDTGAADVRLATREHKPADLFRDEQGQPIYEKPQHAQYDPAMVRRVDPDPELSREHPGVSFGLEPRPVVGMGKSVYRSRRSKLDTPTLDRVQVVLKSKIRRS